MSDTFIEIHQFDVKLVFERPLGLFFFGGEGLQNTFKM